jgi:hypothetical protein
VLPGVSGASTGCDSTLCWCTGALLLLKLPWAVKLLLLLGCWEPAGTTPCAWTAWLWCCTHWWGSWVATPLVLWLKAPPPVDLGEVYTLE